MSEYHILMKSADSRYADVYIHLPIPSNKTTAGNAKGSPEGDYITYQWALKESLESTTSAVPNITGAEQTQLDDGELYEYFVKFRFSSLDLTNAQRRSEVENGNDNEKGVSQMLTEIATPGSDIWNEVLEPLEWFGYYRDIP